MWLRQQAPGGWRKHPLALEALSRQVLSPDCCDLLDGLLEMDEVCVIVVGGGALRFAEVLHIKCCVCVCRGVGHELAGALILKGRCCWRKGVGAEPRLLRPAGRTAKDG